MENKDTGLLLNKEDIELHRFYFEEMVSLLGIQTLYRSPIPGIKNRDLHGELDANYNPPILVGCMFDEHPNVWTMKKLGWNSDLNDSRSIIHVPYDTKNLQAGGLFIIPDPIDNSKGRLFRIYRMSTVGFVYPASIACELGPELENRNEKSTTTDFSNSNFNILKEEED